MSRASLRSLNRMVAGNLGNHAFLSTAVSASSSSPSSSALQTLSRSSPSNPLYHLLPPTQNPSNLVELVCSALKQHPNSHFAVLQTELKSILHHLNADEVSRVLRRCQSDSRSALLFFNWAKHDLGHKHSTFNYCLIVHILSWSKQFGQAMNLLSELIKASEDDIFRSLVLSSKDCNWDPIVFDLLIKAYLKLDLVRLGFTVLVKASELGFAPGVVSCNFLIDKLLKMNRISECWHVYDIMGRLEIHPNVHTFNILTNVLCRDGDVDKVNEFLEKMEEEGFDPDIVSYNTLISSYCRKGRLENAFYLYRIMHIRKTDPDLVTYTALISGLCRAGRLGEAHKLFHKMGTNPDIVTYNTLIHSYSKEGKMRHSRFLLLEMIGKGIFPDDFTCCVMVKGYIKLGNLISALNLVIEVRKFGAKVSKGVYDCLMVSLCREDRPFAAKNFLKIILLDGYSPNSMIYNDLIKSFCKNDYIAEALDMVGKDVDPDFVTIRALVESLCRMGRSGQGEELIEEYGVSPDREMVRALIKGYCREKNVEKAESLLRLLVREFGVWDSECYGELIGVVSEDGDVGRLMELQDRAMKVGFVPDRVSCKYVVQAMCKASGVTQSRANPIGSATNQKSL